MPLAGEGEPLKLADGTVITPGVNRDTRMGRARLDRSLAVGDARLHTSLEDTKFVEVPTAREAQQIVVRTRRKLSDLPELPKTMNAIGVVISYTLFGLDDSEIATATGMNEEQIGRIRVSDMYETMYETITRSIMDAETTNVRDVFQQHARRAANVMVESMDNGSRADRIVAAKDLLDRAGHRPNDVIEHRHKMDGGLTIEIIRRDQHDAPPTIDMGIDQ